MSAHPQPQLLPSWLLVLCGWLLATSLTGLVPVELGPAPEACTLLVSERGPGLPGPRELRRIPGIGLRRALELSRALWLDPSLARDPQRLPGIGPATAAPLSDHLRARAWRGGWLTGTPGAPATGGSSPGGGE